VSARGFAKAVLAALDDASIVGVRSGDEHRFTHVWVVVVNGRVYARSWGDKKTGWYRAFRAEPDGALQVKARTVRVRARPVRSARALDAMEAAYAAKFRSRANRKWVRGFRAAKRRRNSLEFVPR
jgi:hypothetical protein